MKSLEPKPLGHSKGSSRGFVHRLKAYHCNKKKNVPSHFGVDEKLCSNSKRISKADLEKIWFTSLLPRGSRIRYSWKGCDYENGLSAITLLLLFIHINIIDSINRQRCPLGCCHTQDLSRWWMVKFAWCPILAHTGLHVVWTEYSTLPVS